MKPLLQVHTSYIGNTGYANHSRSFFRQLSNYLQLKIHNFTIGDGWEGINSEPHNKEEGFDDLDKKLLSTQWLWEDKDRGVRKKHKIYENYGEQFSPNIDLVLNSTNHHLFYDHYTNPKIAYNVWESTKQPQIFFDKLKEYDQIWVPTKWQAEQTINQGMDPDKVKVVPEGVDVDVFKPKKQTNNNKIFTFLVIGRWEFRKSTLEIVQSFVKVFGDNKDVKLLLCTDNWCAEDGFKNTEERLKHHNCYSDNIELYNFLERDEYVKLIQDCNVFLSCSRSEGWNLPLIEAMSCGIPSIYSNCSGQLEFAKGKGLPVDIFAECDDRLNIGKYYEPDFDHLCDVMKKVHKNYGKYKTKALIDSKIIHDEFNWDKAAKTAFSLLNELAVKNSNKKKFDFGGTYDTFQEEITKELFIRNTYEGVYPVKKGDIVLDIGASVGPFTWDIMDRAKKVYAMEPHKESCEWIRHNTEGFKNVEIIEKALGAETKLNVPFDGWCYDDNKEAPPTMDTITFNDLLEKYNIDKIDFIKTDCEGGEYFLFREENIDFLKNNVRTIVGEWHLHDGMDVDFRYWRDKWLPHFPNCEIHSIDGIDIKWDLYNEHFLEFYKQVIIHINNY
jgi:FkbM family methyltransferase